MARPKFDIIPGTDHDVLIVGIIAAAGVFIALGRGAVDRWEKAVATAGPPAAALYYGKRRVQQEGAKKFREGFETFNPELHVDELINSREIARAARGGGSGVASMVAGGVMAGVAQGVSTAAAEHITERFSPRGPSAESLPPEPPAPPKLPLRPLLEKMTVQELRDYARDTGHGGGGLASAKKAEIIDRLLQA